MGFWVGVVGWFWWGDYFVAEGEASVVEALEEEDYVCYCVVDCQDDLRSMLV